MMPTLDLDQIEKQLSTSFIGRSKQPNELWPTLPSTNQRALDLAQQGAVEGVIVLAREQTAGRGRHGRVWQSPPDAGIYMSVLLAKPKHSLPLLTMACGVAVADAIEAVAGLTVGLKWVNDLIFNKRKLGGILAETSGVSPDYVVLGIGINTNLDPANLPLELRDKIESLEQITKVAIDQNLLVCQIALHLENAYHLLTDGDQSLILQSWRSRSVTLGENVIAQVGTRRIEGRAIDITESGALLVKTTTGRIEELIAGEVQVQLANGAYC